MSRLLSFAAPDAELPHEEPAFARIEVKAGREGEGGLVEMASEARDPHWHVDPGGNDLITQMEGIESPLDWVLGELRRNLPGYLARAKFDSELPPQAPALRWMRSRRRSG